MTKIIKTPAGNYELYPYNIGLAEPKGIQGMCFVLSEKQFINLRIEMEKVDIMELSEEQWQQSKNR